MVENPLVTSPRRSVEDDRRDGVRLAVADDPEHRALVLEDEGRATDLHDQVGGVAIVRGHDHRALVVAHGEHPPEHLLQFRDPVLDLADFGLDERTQFVHLLDHRRHGPEARSDQQFLRPGRRKEIGHDDRRAKGMMPLEQAFAQATILVGLAVEQDQQHGSPVQNIFSSHGNLQSY